MMTDSLGERMKGYEEVSRTILPTRTYTVLRVDGRAFHTLLRGADQPFDTRLMGYLDAVGVALAREVSGAMIGYVQSDEVSIVATDLTSPHTQPWFGGVVQKMVSIAAARASVHFNKVSHYPVDALFDARVFTVPSAIEAQNYLIWRQRDAIRNSISMAAQAVFSHKQLHGVNTMEMIEKLSHEGILWEEYPLGCRYGRTIVRRVGRGPVTWTHKKTGETQTTIADRSWWEPQPAPLFLLGAGLLDEKIPLSPENAISCQP